MSSPLNYLSLSLQIISLYQTQLIKYIQKGPSPLLLDFKKQFDLYYNKIIQIQLLKNIEQDKISQRVIKMKNCLENNIRLRKTSHSQRNQSNDSRTANIATRKTNRMILTGSLSKRISKDSPNLSQIKQIIQSYKISDDSILKTKMHCRYPISDPAPNIDFSEGLLNSPLPGHPNNNVELLGMTIPEIQKRIKRLSSSQQKNLGKSFVQREKEIYRTLQTRGNSFRKYIPRLF